MMTYLVTPNIRTPALGVMKFTILVDPSLDIIASYLFMPGSREEDF